MKLSTNMLAVLERAPADWRIFEPNMSTILALETRGLIDAEYRKRELPGGRQSVGSYLFVRRTPAGDKVLADSREAGS